MPRFSADVEKHRTTHPGWHTRGYIPHYDDGLKIQFLTWRLNDSLPKTALKRLSDELQTPEGDAHYRRRLEQWLDAGHGSCTLREATPARIVQSSLLHFAGLRYELHAWCIMPNHVHVLMHTLDQFTIGQIEHSWRSYTSHEINKANIRVGQLWQRDVWDRDHDHYRRAIDYIELNPVKACLCTVKENWLWSSANPASKEAVEARGTRALPASQNHIESECNG